MFDSYELATGELRLGSSALMRIVTKWSEELEGCFNEREILDREHPFRMENGEERYLSRS